MSKSRKVVLGSVFELVVKLDTGFERLPLSDDDHFWDLVALTSIYVHK